MKRLELAQKLVERSRKLGAEEVEAFVMESSEVDIKIKDGQPETVNYTDSSGYGLRILIDGKMGFASSNNLNLSEADDIITRLIKYTEKHTPDEHNIFPAPPTDVTHDQSINQFDESMATVPVEEKIKKVTSIETAARNADSRILQVPWLQYGDSSRQFAIASSKEISGVSRRSETFGVVMALGMESGSDNQPDPGSAQTGTGIDVKAYFKELDPVGIGQKAARFALRMLGAGDGRTAEVEGVFPPETGFNFIKLVADMAAADMVQKKKSIFADKMGEVVASDMVTIIDDGRLAGGLASSSVDGEGVPTTTKDIIKNGRLTTLLYDSYTAHRDNIKSNGNAVRRSFSSKPYIAPTNFYMKAGNISRDNLIASVKEGLYVTEVSGLHASVDQVTGNFSIPGKGLIIKNGELTTPVTNITVSGNIFDFFKGIDAVADDLTWEPREDTIGVPTFKVNQIKIGGK
jgi:PmbA protein